MGKYIRNLVRSHSRHQNRLCVRNIGILDLDIRVLCLKFLDQRCVIVGSFVLHLEELNRCHLS